MWRPRIEWVEEADAAGETAEAYREWTAQSGREKVPPILKCFSQRPDFFRQVVEFSNTVHFSDGHLDRRAKEMIATYVSGLNRCPY
jgi:alkylhydroperoxidase family enzyme